MSRNPFFDELDPEPVEPVNAFLYPERLEQQAKAAADEQTEARRETLRLRRPRKP